MEIARFPLLQVRQERAHSDLDGGVRFFDEFLLASLDASMSATYFATLLPSPCQESHRAFASDNLS